MKKSLYFLFVYSTPSSCGHSSYIPLRQHPAMLRDRAGGEGNALIRFLYCGYFLTPPSLADTSPIFCYAKHPVILRDTAGRRLIPYDVSCLSFSLYISLRKHPAVLRDTAGRRLIPYDVSCLSFTPPYISLRKHPAVLRDAAREAGNFLLCEFSRAALFFCLIEKPDIKDYRLYRSISSMMSRRLYSRGILCCPPSLLWSRNQASNIPVLAGMISRHSSAILLNRLAS